MRLTGPLDWIAIVQGYVVSLQFSGRKLVRKVASGEIGFVQNRLNAVIVSTKRHKPQVPGPKAIAARSVAE